MRREIDEIRLGELESMLACCRIAKGTWMVTAKEGMFDATTQCYLLEGDEKAIAIDSGMSHQNIREYMEYFTDKPIIGVINTHSHLDHTLDNHFFDHAWFQENVLTPEPENEDAMDNGVHSLKDATIIKEGETLDLGGRILEIYEIPAHDAGSIAIIDHRERILFSGDELESGWCNVGNMMGKPRKSGTIERHYQNMLKLRSLEDQFDCICPGHHGAPVTNELLDDAITLDKMILDGNLGTDQIPPQVMGGHETSDARILRYGTSKRGFSMNAIWEDQIKE